MFIILQGESKFLINIIHNPYLNELVFNEHRNRNAEILKMGMEKEQPAHLLLTYSKI